MTTYDNLKILSKAELLEAIKPIINKLYSEYNFAEIDKEEFDDLVIRAIDDLKEEKSHEKLEEQIIKLATININHYIKEKMKDNEVALTIINNIFGSTYNNESYDELLNDLKKLLKTLNVIGYQTDFNMTSLFLTKNEKLNLTIEKIVNKNLENIKKNKVIESIRDSLFTDLLLQYCAYNDIETVDLEEINDEDISLSADYYNKEINKYKVLTKEEEYEIFMRINQGDEEAKKELILHNLRLVRYIAYKYVKSASSLSLADLIQEGNIGLMIAVDKFDMSRGCKFSTYATHWISQRIGRALVEQGTMIRYPVGTSEKIKKIIRTQDELLSQLGREPTLEEIAKKLNYSLEYVQKMYDFMKIMPTSLNVQIGDKEDAELQDMIMSDEAVEEEVLLKIQNERILEILNSINLKPKELIVITLRMGLDGSENIPTLEAVGNMLGVTRERIRQIEKRALNKIRRSRYIKELAEYNQSFSNNLVQETKKGREQSMINESINEKFYSIFTKYTKEEIDAIVNTLSEDEILLTEKKIAADNKSKNCKKLFKYEKEQFVQLCTKIGKKLDKLRLIGVENVKYLDTKLIKPFITTINGYSKEELDVVMASLTEEELSLISKRDNGGTDKCRVLPDDWTTEDDNNLQLLYNKIYKKLEDNKNARIKTISVIRRPRNIDKIEKKEIIVKPVKQQDKPVKSIDKVEKKEITMKTIKQDKPAKSVYKVLQGTKEEIDIVISTLSENEINLLHRRYGEDLENPTISTEEWTKEDNSRLYGSLFGKMKNRLKRLQNGKPLTNSKIEITIEKPSQHIDATQTAQPVVTTNTIIEQPKPTTEETIDHQSKELNKDDYFKMLDLLKTPTFSEMLTTLSVKDAVIISLKLGYVDEKYFSTESISKFLDISEEEVMETTKKVLQLYRNNINDFIDKAINMTESNTQTGYIKLKEKASQN